MGYISVEGGCAVWNEKGQKPKPERNPKHEFSRRRGSVLRAVAIMNAQPAKAGTPYGELTNGFCQAYSGLFRDNYVRKVDCGVRNEKK